MTRADFPEESSTGDGRGDRPFEAQVKACYPADYLADFCERFGMVDDSQRHRFRSFLVNAGCRYFLDPLPPQDHLGSRDTRKALRDVAAQIAGLRQSLQSLSPQAERRLWQADLRARSEIFPPDRLSSSFGHKADAYEFKPGEWIYWFLDRGKIEEAIEILENYARASLAVLPDLPGGRPGMSEGLRMWVLNAESLWTRGFGRPFTSDWNKGQPIAPAAQFCRELLSRIDPNLPSSKIETAMRKQIAETRRRASRKNPQ